MKITLQTTVEEAFHSVELETARKIFARHGVSPEETCKGMYDMVTLEDAEEWCGIQDLEGLMRELQEAQPGEHVHR